MSKYDPRKVDVIIDGHTVQGFADGTFINGSRNEDSRSFHVGAKGEVTTDENADKTGTTEITLKNNSPSLSKFQSLDRRGERFPMSVYDRNMGNNVGIGSGRSWVMNMGDFERGEETVGKTITIGHENYNEVY